MRILITGGAGFVGSHLVDTLLKQGHYVICVDSFYSGKKENIAEYLDKPNFEFIKHDIRRPLKMKLKKLDRIFNLACPASPVQYQFDPVLTLETNILGVKNMLDLARMTGARLLQASTSEIYGDPLEHPQRESYWGNVDPLGQRSCYDEGKRAAETLCKDFHEQYGVDTRIVRIFNTYGPRMMLNDGRVLSNFIVQSLSGDDITVHGDGNQTRSFMYVSDLVEGMIRVMETADLDWHPFNLGNPDERDMMSLAELVKKKSGSDSAIVKIPFSQMPSRLGDPKQRCPDITRSIAVLNWRPQIDFASGLDKTIADFKNRFSRQKSHVAVFSYGYNSGDPIMREAVDEIIKRSPAWDFDIYAVGAKNGMEKKNNQVTVYTVKGGRWLFPLRAALLARKNYSARFYVLVWAITANSGALAAVLFSLFSREATPFLLSVYETKITDEMLKKGKTFSPFYSFIFKKAQRWQVVAPLNEQQRYWLENEREVQVVKFDGNWDALAKNTREMFQDLEILKTRI